MADPTPAEKKQGEARRLLRLFLNDTPLLNRLIRREESDDPKLDLAILLTIDDWNITPPPLGNVTIDTFPSLWLLIYGSAIHVLRSAGLLQSRNDLPYSSGGVSVRLWDKTQLYQSWIAQFVQEYERKKLNLKMAMNIEASLASGVRSEYWTISRYW
jgi:hypothetical protein